MFRRPGFLIPCTEDYGVKLPKFPPMVGMETVDPKHVEWLGWTQQPELGEVGCLVAFCFASLPRTQPSTLP